ncbi:MAG: hypothetical protein IM638_09785 [Bacteroidetes bacterium]|nr:hypothetical protein [Bacteroidota bacterium]
MKIFFAAAVFLLLHACASPSSPPNQDRDSTPVAPAAPAVKTVTIANTGLSIDIPSDMELSIAQDTAYVFANIFPKDKNQHDILEVSLYLGPAPNRDVPTQKHTRSELQGSLLGRTVNWVTYSTTNWQHQEVIIDYDTKKKQYLHVWCNGRNADELTRAMNVIKTLREEPAK